MVFLIVKILGASLLAGLGALVLRSVVLRLRKTNVSETMGLPALSGCTGGPWRVGFLANVSNPKALAFFSGLFTAFLPRDPSVSLRVLVIVSMVSVAFAWYCIVAWLFSLPAVRRQYARLQLPADALVGAVFLGLAATVLLES